jgi:hypothetical protein
MQPIDPKLLETVHGGFIGALLGAVGPIMSGVSGIIGASKAKKAEAAAAQGGGGGGPAPAPGGGGGPPPGAAVAAPGMSSGDDRVAISININGVAVR